MTAKRVIFIHDATEYETVSFCSSFLETSPLINYTGSGGI